jgi:hypothetical protein
MPRLAPMSLERNHPRRRSVWWDAGSGGRPVGCVALRLRPGTMNAQDTPHCETTTDAGKRPKILYPRGPNWSILLYERRQDPCPRGGTIAQSPAPAGTGTALNGGVGASRGAGREKEPRAGVWMRPCKGGQNMKRVRFALVVALILLAVHSLPTDARGASGGGSRGGGGGGFHGGGGGGFHGGSATWTGGGGFHGGAPGWRGGFHGANPAWGGGFHGGTRVFIGGGGWWGWPGWWGPGWGWGSGWGWGPGWYGYPYPYYTAPPVVTQPTPTEYVQQPATPPQQAYWYYCQSAGAYYPYVNECPGGWMQVVPQAPPPAR